MVFMEINVMFDNTSSQFNNTSSSSADRQKAPPTNLDTQILPKKLEEKEEKHLNDIEEDRERKKKRGDGSSRGA